MKKESGNLIMNWQRPMLWTLAVFTLGSMVVALVGEAFKTHLIWYIRFADFVDLVIIAPLYLFTLLLFHEQFLRGRASRRLRWVFLVLAILYLYGHAMHLTANTIDTFSTEIRDYRPLLPDDTYALIYFLDETLSHLIVFISRYGLFACLLALEARHLASAASSRPQWPAVGVGVLYGLWEAIVFTEGQKVLLVPVLVVALGGLWVWLWRQSGSSFSTFARSGPVTAFVAGLLPSVVVGLGVYALVVGGFTEPSELSLLGLQLACTPFGTAR